MLEKLFNYGCNSITVQTGSTLNAVLLREKLINKIDIVVAPVLVGGKDTPGLVGGESLTSTADLSKLAVLKLEKAKVLNNSYIELIYNVIR